jgi:hypothetical protein
LSGGEFEVVLLDAALSGLTLEQADLVDVAVSQGDPRPGVAGVTALGLVEDLAVDAVAVRGDVDCIPAGSLRASSSSFAEGNRVRKSSAGLTTANALTLRYAVTTIAVSKPKAGGSTNPNPGVLTPRTPAGRPYAAGYPA